MNTTLQKILTHRDTKRKPPAARTLINQLESKFPGNVPALLIELWQQSDGIIFKRFDAELLSLTNTIELIEKNYWVDFQIGEVIPIFDNHNSDYHVVCMDDSLANRILFTSHEGDARFVYRDVEKFFEEILVGLECNKRADLFFHHLEDDFFPEKPRTPEDHFAALKILAQPAGDFNWNLAIQLLDESDPTFWKQVLETNHFIRRDARAYLSRKSSPRLKELYEQDQREFAAFCDLAQKAVIEAGLPFRERKGDSLNINGRWMGLDGWFHMRNDPDVLKLLTDPKRYQ